MRPRAQLPSELALWFSPHAATHTGGNAASSKPGLSVGAHSARVIVGTPGM